ncbi:hypothetical protein B0H10DRAFT_1424458 [Mycena sp. CBHHK59/15]|nr:hypothetical protein B0H10DRAFT_1424458 [Mycena sp. CBHHK59/15]
MIPPDTSDARAAQPSTHGDHSPLFPHAQSAGHPSPAALRPRSERPLHRLRCRLPTQATGPVAQRHPAWPVRCPSTSLRSRGTHRCRRTSHVRRARCGSTFAARRHHLARWGQSPRDSRCVLEDLLRVSRPLIRRIPIRTPLVSPRMMIHPLLRTIIRARHGRQAMRSLLPPRATDDADETSTGADVVSVRSASVFSPCRSQSRWRTQSPPHAYLTAGRRKSRRERSPAAGLNGGCRPIISALSPPRSAEKSAASEVGYCLQRGSPTRRRQLPVSLFEAGEFVRILNVTPTPLPWQGCPST